MVGAMRLLVAIISAVTLLSCAGLRSFDNKGERDSPDSKEFYPQERLLSATPYGMTSEMLREKAGDLMGEGVAVVKHGGGERLSWEVILDVDGNGYDDYVVLTMLSQRGGYVVDTELLNPNRLLAVPAPYESFILAVFYQDSKGVVEGHLIPLEDKLVLRSMGIQPLRVQGATPVAIIISFQATDAIEEEWVILADRSYSRFSLEQSLTTKTMVRDIDGDDLLDLVVHRDSFEEGVGYETFLSWYSWSEGSYTLKDRTNVLRNLQTFFRNISEEMVATSPGEALSRVMNPKDIEVCANAGLGWGEIVNLFFLPVDNKKIPLTEAEPVRVVFPNILENPFSYHDSEDPKVTFLLKLVDSSIGDLFYRCSLEMASNPFKSPQFLFCMINPNSL